MSVLRRVAAMSDFQHIRCRTCCTAASGGDALAHDSNLHAPFIGGFIDRGNNTRWHTVDAALAVAKELRAASVPILALCAAAAGVSANPGPVEVEVDS